MSMILTLTRGGGDLEGFDDLVGVRQEKKVEGVL